MNQAAQRWGCGILALFFIPSSVAFLGLCGGAEEWPQLSALAQERGRIRVEVNLVTIITSVVGKDGRPVPDLPKEAFQIYEEGVPQKLEVFEAETSQPLDLALMIDSSLSTLKELAFEREAAAHFIRQVVRPGDRLAVFQFADLVIQLSEFSDNVSALQTAV